MEKQCKLCIEKRRADYWHKVATFLFAVIGGILGGTAGAALIRLFG